MPLIIWGFAWDAFFLIKQVLKILSHFEILATLGDFGGRTFLCLDEMKIVWGCINYMGICMGCFVSDKNRL